MISSSMTNPRVKIYFIGTDHDNQTSRIKVMMVTSSLDSKSNPVSRLNIRAERFKYSNFCRAISLTNNQNQSIDIFYRSYIYI